jgi:hypothetical protein
MMLESSSSMPTVIISVPVRVAAQRPQQDMSNASAADRMHELGHDDTFFT